MISFVYYQTRAAGSDTIAMDVGNLLSILLVDPTLDPKQEM